MLTPSLEILYVYNRERRAEPSLAEGLAHVACQDLAAVAVPQCGVHRLLQARQHRICVILLRLGLACGRH